MKDNEGNKINVGDIVEYVEEGEDEYGTRMRVREIKPGRCRCDDAINDPSDVPGDAMFLIWALPDQIRKEGSKYLARIRELEAEVDDLRNALNHANGVIQKLDEGEA